MKNVVIHGTNAHWLDEDYCFCHGYNFENIKEIRHFLNTQENIADVNIYAHEIRCFDYIENMIDEIKSMIDWCNENCEEKFFCAGYPSAQIVDIDFKYSCLTLLLFTSQKDAAKFLIFGT